MCKSSAILCCGFVALVASEAHAAELIFKNGERLKGTIVELTEASVHFQSTNLGAITVPRSAVEIIGAPVPKADVAQVLESPAGSPEEPSEAISAQEGEDRRLHDIALDGWTSLWERNAFWATVERYWPLKTWKNRVDFGFFFENNGSKDLRYDFGFSTKKRIDAHETWFDFSYAYRRRDDDVIRNWTRGSLLYRYDMSERFFFQSNARYQRRPEESIYSELSESVGLGYRWLATDTMRGAITPEIGVTYADIGTTETKLVAIGSIVQDVEIDVSNTLTLLQDLVVQYSPSDNGDFVVNFQVGVENRITKSLSLRLAYDFIYDERVQFEDQETKETTKITFGAHF